MINRRWVLGVAGVAFGVAHAAMAEGPATSLRPLPRPVAIAPAPAVAAEVAPAAPVVTAAQDGSIRLSLRPRPRPEGLRAAAPDTAVTETAAPVPEPMAAAVAPAPKRGGLFGFLRPAKRPKGLDQETRASAGGIKVTPGKEAVVSKKGSVCGDPAIKGEKLAPITAKVKGCGLKEPVRVTSVAGVRLSQAATIDCATATALKTWVKKAVEPTYGKGKVVELQIAAHYICRSRNNVRGAKISEHGRGKAVDVSGLTFSNGKTVTVARNYDKSMRKVHKAACGIFGTTLGPGSDGYHEDHLHFDTASYRNGPYCR